MGGASEEGVVHSFVVMERVDEGGEIVLLYLYHLVFAFVDSTLHAVGFVVVHGIADREAAHKVRDAGCIPT